MELNSQTRFTRYVNGNVTFPKKVNLMVKASIFTGH